MVARDFERARAAAKAAEAAVMRGDDLPPLHGLPFGVKDLEEVAGLRTTWGSPIFRDHVPAARPARSSPTSSAPAASCWARPTRRNGAPAPTPATRSTAPPATRSTRPARPPVRPAARRWRWPPAWCRWPPARTPAARCATRPPSAASSASAPPPAWCRARSAPMGWSPLPVLGPMARNVPDACLLLSAMAEQRRRRPAGHHHFQPPRAHARGFLSAEAGRSQPPPAWR